MYLRIDSIEQEIRNAYDNKGINEHDIGPEGYRIAFALAGDNLSLGLSVVADSVNPIELSRTEWRQVAIKLNKPYIEIELLCSDKIEHRRRVEKRDVAIAGLKLPTWQEVMDREYEPWQTVGISLDTSLFAPDEAVEQIIMDLEKLS